MSTTNSSRISNATNIKVHKSKSSINTSVEKDKKKLTKSSSMCQIDKKFTDDIINKYSKNAKKNQTQKRQTRNVNSHLYGLSQSTTNQNNQNNMNSYCARYLMDYLVNSNSTTNNNNNNYNGNKGLTSRYNFYNKNTNQSNNFILNSNRSHYNPFEIQNFSKAINNNNIYQNINEIYSMRINNGSNKNKNMLLNNILNNNIKNNNENNNENNNFSNNINKLKNIQKSSTNNYLKIYKNFNKNRNVNHFNLYCNSTMKMKNIYKNSLSKNDNNINNNINFLNNHPYNNFINNLKNKKASSNIKVKRLNKNSFSLVHTNKFKIREHLSNSVLLKNLNEEYKNKVLENNNNNDFNNNPYDNPKKCKKLSSSMNIEINNFSNLVNEISDNMSRINESKIIKNCEIDRNLSNNNIKSSNESMENIGINDFNHFNSIKGNKSFDSEDEGPEEFHFLLVQVFRKQKINMYKMKLKLNLVNDEIDDNYLEK